MQRNLTNCLVLFNTLPINPNKEGNMSIENLLQQIKEAKVYKKDTDIKVSHLINDFKDGLIVIPEYQRQFVWDTSIQSRFVESIFMRFQFLQYSC